jgi:lipopolysaccharide biosynthesis regulator YciM
MTEYFAVFFVLLVGAIAFYLAYERFFRGRKKPDSSFYVDALRDLLDGRSESAFTKLRQVVASDTSNIDAYLRLAQILREHNKPERALQVHKDLTLRSGLSREQKAAILHQLGADYLTLGELDTAQAAFTELISLMPQDRRAYEQLLKTHKRLLQWDEAYDVAAQVLKLEGNKSKKPLAVFRYQKGLELEKKDEHRKARGLFKEAIGLDGEFVPAYLAVGDSYIVEERFEDAVNFWNKLIVAVPSEGHQVIERLQKTLFDLGRFGDITGVCRDILKHSPRDFKVRMTLAKFYEKKGEMDLAEELMARLVEDEPENLTAIIELIRLYLDKKEPQKIKALLRDLEQDREKRRKTAAHGVVDTSLIGIG